YQVLLPHGFAYEDNTYVSGQSVLNKDFPNVLPRPANGCGGTGATSGTWTNSFNLFYQSHAIDSLSTYVLEFYFANSESKAKHTVQVAINGVLFNYDLKNGTGDSDPVAGQLGAEKIRIDIKPEILKNGFNQVSITSLKGGWVEFDSFRLLGPSKTKL